MLNTNSLFLIQIGQILKRKRPEFEMRNGLGSSFEMLNVSLDMVAQKMPSDIMKQKWLFAALTSQKLE